MHSFDSIALKEWFIANKRDFPWRNQPTPYAVWISEVMLQQTRASVVVGYFEKWMRRFPTISSLASASGDEVMKVWEGLGYYSRARNLHEAAKYLVEKHEGQLPNNREDLEKIKGLGPYTVGAILSFAFQQKAAAVDGNVLRVLSRYFLIEEDIQKSSVQKKLRELTEAILPSLQPWIVMEALIELGAQVCVRRPKCTECPLQRSCLGYETDQALHLPIKGKKTDYLSLKRYAFVMMYEDEFLVRKEGQAKVMNGLYEFPYLEFTGKRRSPVYLKKTLADAFGIKANFYQHLPVVKHSFTRYKVELFPSIWKVEEAKIFEEYTWVQRKAVKDLPFSSGHRRILQLIEEN